MYFIRIIIELRIAHSIGMGLIRQQKMKLYVCYELTSTLHQWQLALCFLSQLIQ